MKNHGETLGTRLRQARKSAGLTLEEAGRRLDGISPQAVQQWEKDRTAPDPERLQAAAVLYGVNVGWLITGTALQDANNAVNFRLISQLRGRPVPRLTLKEVTEGRFYSVDRNFLHTHFPCSDRSYAITIEDTSCSDEFMPGDSVVIDPDLAPLPGDMVLAVVGNEPVFRRYKLLSKAPLRFALEPLNPLWSTDESADASAILGVMSEHTRPRRR